MSLLRGQLVGAARSPVGLVYALVFANASILTSFFAVAPTFTDRFDLTKVETSAFYAANGAVFLLLALPVGMLADRVGARRVVVVAAALLAVAAAGHAVAVDFWSLLAARLVFGLGSAGILTAGLSWLTDSCAPARRAAALGAVMPVAGTGALVAPAAAGYLADAAGTELPYALLALLCTLVFGLVLAAGAGGRARHEPLSLAELARAAHSSPLVVFAVLLFVLGGLAEILASLLVPLQLDANGLSAGEIGAVLSVGSAAFVLVSLGVVRMAGRMITLRAAALALVLLAASLAPLIATTSTAPQAAGVIARTAVLGVLYTVAFPLAASGALRAGIGVGAVNGLVMLSSGFANTVGPLAGSGIAQAIGDGWVYTTIAIGCVAAAGWALLVDRNERRAPRGPAVASVPGDT